MLALSLNFCLPTPPTRNTRKFIVFSQKCKVNYIRSIILRRKNAQTGECSSANIITDYNKIITNQFILKIL